MRSVNDRGSVMSEFVKLTYRPDDLDYPFLLVLADSGAGSCWGLDLEHVESLLKQGKKAIKAYKKETGE